MGTPGRPTPPQAVWSIEPRPVALHVECAERRGRRHAMPLGECAQPDGDRVLKLNSCSCRVALERSLRVPRHPHLPPASGRGQCPHPLDVRRETRLETAAETAGVEHDEAVAKVAAAAGRAFLSFRERFVRFVSERFVCDATYTRGEGEGVSDCSLNSRWCALPAACAQLASYRVLEYS